MMMDANRIVSREEWLKARVELLKEEKEFTRRRDALAQKARALPWVKVEKSYSFDALPSMGGGKKSLADLFGGRSQLVVYHFMFDPTWSQGCKSCSFIADHYNPLVIHLAHRDIALVTVSKASVEKIEAFRKRMGWMFPWVSSAGNDFGRDMGVSYTDEELLSGKAMYNYAPGQFPIRELPGLSVFFRNERGEIFHTYSTYARGLERFLGAYEYMDVTPRGRDEAKGEGMDWLRHHDRYDGSAFVHPWMERPGVTMPVMPGHGA
ncbi:MAG: DUF899 domain-containing protein [Phycisphaerae bacterium]|nr:DUF899 domain-containing protein [Phycisphaerae bacterium]